MKKIIELKHITKSFDGEPVLKSIDLDIYDNEFITLLGPSGCGKTTLLRLIGGFETPDEGDVLFLGQKINNVPPYKRSVNTVFQKYALFPHLNVFENVAFPLREKKVPKEEIEAKVMEMLHYVRENTDPADDGSVTDYLNRLLDREAGDHSGKLYGLGHAVYTMSDPRAVMLKKYARSMAEKKGFTADFELLEKIETLGIRLLQERRRSDTPMCANVDLYSGLVYTMLGIPEELFTPLFASARISGWCANRIEEILTGKRIMRPAYRAVTIRGEYVPIEARTPQLLPEA